jgi:hypothetical protein
MAKKTALTEVKKTAALEIDGTVYPLAYDFNSICDAEQFAGVNLLAGLQDMANLSVSQLRGLLLAAIRAGDSTSKLTLTEVGEMLRFDTVLLATEKLAESIVLSIPKKEQTTEAAA